MPDSPPDDEAKDDGRVALSPLHSIQLSRNLHHLIRKPPEKDFPLHSIARKTGPDGRELVHMEIVIAGKRARAEFPLAARYPVHFLKSYHPWSYHGDPRVEFDNTVVAARILGTPQPIGCDQNSFRTPFLPGKPLSRLSPFTGIDPPARCLEIVRRVDPLILIGLWRLAEEVYASVTKLHTAHFCHGDLELQNIIVCTSPLQTFLIDFEGATPVFAGPDKVWQQRRARDLFELNRLAIYVQCGLGRQQSPLAQASLDVLPTLFTSPSTFAARLDAADRRAADAQHER